MTDILDLRLPDPSYVETRMQCTKDRVSSLESLSLITVLLAGYALAEFGLCNPAKWTTPHFYEAYLFLLTCVIIINLYISIVAVLIIVVVKRISSWDTVFQTSQLTAAELWENNNYKFMMEWLYGKDLSRWTEVSKEHKFIHMDYEQLPEMEDKVLRLPLMSQFYRYMADGPWTIFGMGVQGLPVGTVAYFLAMLLNVVEDLFREGRPLAMITIVSMIFVGTGLVMGRIIHRAIKIVMF
mmetsp:Transcript_1489/g.2526  ORF Transcript_1489/g.2526 Transcript_1489/m.2526 type:complete len:239 (-) Transcript_1489:50-766(-)